MKFDEMKRALIGEWRGTKQLYLEPPPAPPVSSPSKMSVKPVAGGSFLQFDYDWTYEGEQQAGLLLFGCDEENGASAAWVDSFHMSTKIMSCAGSAVDGSAELSGTDFSGNSVFGPATLTNNVGGFVFGDLQPNSIYGPVTTSGNV